MKLALNFPATRLLLTCVQTEPFNRQISFPESRSQIANNGGWDGASWVQIKLVTRDRHKRGEASAPFWPAPQHPRRGSPELQQ